MNCVLAVVAVAGAECSECSRRSSRELGGDGSNAYVLHTAGSPAGAETSPGQPACRRSNGGDHLNVSSEPSSDDAAAADAGGSQVCDSVQSGCCSAGDNIDNNDTSDNINVRSCRLTTIHKQPENAAGHHSKHARCYDVRRRKGVPTRTTKACMQFCFRPPQNCLERNCMRVLVCF